MSTCCPPFHSVKYKVASPSDSPRVVSIISRDTPSFKTTSITINLVTGAGTISIIGTASKSVGTHPASCTTDGVV